MTFGEKLVGLQFNPSNDNTVQELKELYARIIDICVQVTVSSEEQSFILNNAITQAIDAQMWAVKAVTYKG